MGNTGKEKNPDTVGERKNAGKNRFELASECNFTPEPVKVKVLMSLAS